MGTRKPQISFQVAENLKLVYEVASYLGAHNVTRLCAAGLLFVLENPEVRQEALNRLVEFETSKDSPRTQEQVEAYIRGLAGVVEDMPPSQQVPPLKDVAKGRRGS